MSQPAKVLLLYAHPESQDSVANRVLLKPATQLSINWNTCAPTNRLFNIWHV